MVLPGPQRTGCTVEGGCRLSRSAAQLVLGGDEGVACLV